MKRIFKKNQIIITTLAIMIAIAGYLNYSGRILEKKADTVSMDDSTVLLTDENGTDDYADVYSDIVSLDGDGTDDAEDTGTAAGDSQEAASSDSSVGEAVLASAGAGNNILAEAKLNREQVRAKSKEALQEVIDNSAVTDEQKQEAVSAMTSLALNAEAESSAELLLEAKGFDDCVVSVTDGSVDVVVQEASLTEAQRAQIEDVVKRKTGVSGENIIITPGLAADAAETKETEVTDAAADAETAGEASQEE